MSGRARTTGSTGSVSARASRSAGDSCLGARARPILGQAPLVRGNRGKDGVAERGRRHDCLLMTHERADPPEGDFHGSARFTGHQMRGQRGEFFGSAIVEAVGAEQVARLRTRDPASADLGSYWTLVSCW